MLGLLGKYPKEQSEVILRLIIRQLKRYSKSENDLKQYLAQLQILSNLRNLDQLTNKIIKVMPLILNLRENYAIKEIIEEEKDSRNKEIIANCFKQNLSIKQISAITGLSIETINQIKKELEKKKNN